MTVKNCLVCGKEFVRVKQTRRIYCSKECQYIATLEKQKLYKRNMRELEKKKIHIDEPKPKKGLSIKEINERALKEHLSYGQYVSKYGL